MIITPLHEANDCHEPAGRPTGGRFCGGSSIDISTAHADDLNRRLQSIESGMARGKTGEDGDFLISEATKQRAAAIIAAGVVNHPDLRKVTAWLSRNTDAMDATGFASLQQAQDHAEMLANLLLQAWAESSTDGDVMQAVQSATKDLFGLTGATTAHLKGSRALYELSPSLFQAAVRAQYDATQAWFASRGITEVTVYRGTAVEKDVKLGTAEPVTLTMQPLSSFTVNLDTATRFANIHADRPYWIKSGRFSVLATSRVPVNRVLSTAHTGFGAASERELTLLGGTLDAVGYRPTTLYYGNMVRNKLAPFEGRK